MKLLRVFGSLDLRGPEGEAIDSVLSQPKRCALLTYLAVARPRGFRRRDTLLAVFWPESDAEHARRALSTSLSFLRRSLGQEVIVTRGSEEVGLNPDAIQADVWAFEGALEAGRASEALEEYRGHLLEGFFLSGCPGFEEWLEKERERLRRLAAAAAWDTATQRIEAGDLPAGERLGHQALTLGGTDESAVRTFIRSLVNAGDRARAVRFCERFARALDQELGLRPSAETRKLMEEVRMSRGGGVSVAAHSGADLDKAESASVLDRLRASLAERYFIEGEIGRGGMATVYVAHDLKHDRKVAFKVLDPHLAATVGTDRFLREIKTAAKLAHPHILPLLDSGRAGDLLYYVMPHVEGESLRARLDREGQLPLDDAIRITGEIADALAYAHEQNVLHRDVKPSNILLEAGHAVLADFGVARALAEADEEKPAQSDGSKIARTGQTWLTHTGTPAYMSPEQASGALELDQRSDQYALACVLYEMLTGAPPFRGAVAESVVRQHLSDEPPPVTRARPGVAEGVASALHRALSKDPADRFPSTIDFGAKLAAGLRTAVTGAMEEERERQQGPRPVVPKPALVGLGAGIILGGAWWLALQLMHALEKPLGRQDAVVTAASALPDAGRSLAILPLANLSDNRELDFFVDGIHHAIVAEVNRIDSLRVIPQQSVLRFRDSDLSLSQIANELGTKNLVGGSALPSGDSIRLALWLSVASPRERQIWTGEYVGHLGDLSFVREVAREIATQLEVALSAADELRLSEHPAIDPEARRLHLLGMYHGNNVRPGDLERCVAYESRATEIEPTYVDAFVTLGFCHSRRPYYTRTPPSEAMPSAEAALTRALELEPENSTALTLLSWIQIVYDYDWKKSRASCTRAIRIEPDDPLAWLYCGLLLSWDGQHEAALRELRTALQWDPASLIISSTVGWVRLLARDYEGAVSEYRRTLELQPDYFHSHSQMGLAYLEMGMADSALAAQRRAVDYTEGQNPTMLGRLGYTYGRVGQVREAREILQSLIRERENGYSPAYYIAAIHLALDDANDALDWLDTAYEERDGRIPWLKVDPIWDPLRDHPRFRALLEEYAADVEH